MDPHRLGDILRMFSASILAGVAIGLLGSAFRAALEAAGRLRDALIAQAHLSPIVGFAAIVAGVAAAAMFARWLVVRFAPVAAGSGVQHVEGVLRGESEPAGLAVIPVKFLGGLSAIGAGLPLGREGPTVQMGAVIGNALGVRLLRDPANRPAIMAAGAGAGLGVAFNTPLGAAVFVFEELTRSFVPRHVLATLAAAATAMAVMRFVMGDSQLFVAGTPAEQPLSHLPAHFVLGALLGLAGAFYSRLTTVFLDLADGLRVVPSILRAGLIGAVIGGVGWFLPSMIGGGEALTQDILSAAPGVSVLVLILCVRIMLGPLSYAAGVPGGLFAPLLVIGAAFGSLAALLAAPLGAGLVPSPLVCSVVGMAALFTAVVRAPVTGIVMTIEMTGRPDCTLAMVTACLAATLLASLVGSEPIYQTLWTRSLGRPGTKPTHGLPQQGAAAGSETTRAS